MPNLTSKVSLINELCSLESEKNDVSADRSLFKPMLTRQRSEISKDNIDDSSAFQFHLQEKLFLDTLYFFGKPNFSEQFKKITKRYIKVGYNLDVMRQPACLV